MIDFALVKRRLLAEGSIKDSNKIKQPKLNRVTVTVAAVFPSLLWRRRTGEENVMENAVRYLPSSWRRLASGRLTRCPCPLGDLKIELCHHHGVGRLLVDL